MKQDIIRLLPDSVANQIAAGEVIQRPASAVKELMENAVDAGATDIKVIIKDAGRTLIQVTDNGSGMSETDARMALERHATSKITAADDLWHIRTMGFRGEALASMAAISHFEIKTRREDMEAGVCILCQGSEVKVQEPCQHPVGTSMALKNLFYNVPARRNFLKSDPVEMRHIIDEFQRVALIHEHIGFQLVSNEKEVFRLPASSMRQRLVNIMGKGYNERLAPMGVDTDFVKVTGFIGKPEFAKHTRGEQFFFLNRRFIKNHFFHHAVQSAYQGLLAHDRHPLYMIHIEVDPATVDVNIHPTKTEVKFRDEKAVYAVIHAAVREAIGKFALSPSLDFEQEQSMSPLPSSNAGIPMRPPEIKINPDYNPFRTEPKTPNLASRYSPESGSSPADWRQLFEVAKTFQPTPQPDKSEPVGTAYLPGLGEETFEKPLFQLMNKYVVTVIKSGLMVVDIRRARERIFYEQFIAAGADNPAAVQQLLFPLTVDVSSADAALIDSMSEDLQKAGFDVSAFGRDSIIVNGLPADCEIADPARFIEVFLEQVKHETDVLRNPAREAVFRSLARSASARPHRHLEKEEMRDLIDRLFACEAPGHAPGGLPVLITFSGTELEEKFKSR